MAAISRPAPTGPVLNVWHDVIERDGTIIACTSLDSALAVAQRPSVDASHIRISTGHVFGRVTVTPHRLNLHCTALIRI